MISDFSAGELIDLLSDSDAHVRAWSIQLLCEDHEASDSALQRFAELAHGDSSPVVRLYLAAALQRIPDTHRWTLAERLVQHEVDADDHNIPKMIWFGIEGLVPQDPQRAVRLAQRSQHPLIARHVARRLADADQLPQLVAGLQQESPTRYEMLLGMRDGLEGRHDLRPPANWTEAYATLVAVEGDTSRVAVELAQQFGDVRAAAQLLETLTTANAPVVQRRSALLGLANQQDDQLLRRLPDLLDDADLRQDVIRAVAAYEDPRLATLLLEKYAEFDEQQKLEAVQALAARSSYGWELTQAIRRGEVPRRDVPLYVARQLRRAVGNGFLEVWGPLDALSTDQEAAFVQYRSLLNDTALAAADPSRGRAVFKRTCAACHTLYGEGGNIGPDITGANRTNINYLLDNVLTPSAVIQDAYKMLIVITHQGRVYSGILAGENERQLRLRVANQTEPVVIAKSQIESREVAAVSMMPDRLLQDMPEQDVLDLVSYLRTSRQVPVAE